jgi:hypothetical protein
MTAPATTILLISLGAVPLAAHAGAEAGASAQMVSVSALLETMGVPIDKRGPEGAFDDGLRTSVPVQPTVFEALGSLMAGADLNQRVEAAYAFGIIAGPGAPGVPPPELAQASGALMQMIKAGQWRTRVAGARVAGRAFTTPLRAASPIPRPAGLLDALFGLLNGEQEIDQLAAMDALGRLREPTAVNSLIERYAYYRRHGTRVLAGGAVEALARIGHPAAAPLVSALATDRWSDRRDPAGLAVLFARERLLHDGSIASIRGALERKELRVQARSYLDELGER